MSRTTMLDALASISPPRWSPCRASECSEIVPFKVTGRAVEPDLRSEPRDPPTDISEVKGEQASKLRLTPDGAAELASVLQSAHRDVNTKIADADDPVLRETLLERRRLLEGLAAQLA